MHQSTKLFLGLIAILSFGLLIGLRFGASWAGGDGLEQHALVTTPGGAVFERGQIISWKETDQFFIGETTVHLDQNTDVKIVGSITGEEVINVIEGRVLAEGPITIEVRELDVQLDGTTSFVHYSWLDEIEVMNIDGSVVIETGETELTVTAGEGARMRTMAPYEFFPSILDLESSSAARFYEKTLP